MVRVAKFEKVSFEQFRIAMIDCFPELSEVREEELKETYEALSMPARSTSGSAGYDIHSPVPFFLAPGKTIKFPTGIRAKIESGWFLMCVPRSGIGFKYKAKLDNTIGVIDQDYYYSDNEGQMYVKITNTGEKSMSVGADERIVQAIFLPYGITYDDHVETVRNGGFGSTGK